MFRNEKPLQCSVRSSHIPFNTGKSFLMSLAKETEGGRGRSFSVKTMRVPPANVIDRVGRGVWDNDTGVGNEAGTEIGIGGWAMNEAAIVAPVHVFPAVFQIGMPAGGSANNEGSCVTKLLGVGCTGMPRAGGGGSADTLAC